MPMPYNEIEVFKDNSGPNIFDRIGGAADHPPATTIIIQVKLKQRVLKGINPDKYEGPDGIHLALETSTRYTKCS